MAQQMIYTPEEEAQLMRTIWTPDLSDDPYSFVMFAFPWGKKGTPLEHFTGPRAWQKEVLLQIKDHIHRNKVNRREGMGIDALRSAVSSGRGIGKSALVSWLILWMLSTRIGSTVVVSANSEPQLKSVTWAELTKWAAMVINSHWFEVSATKLFPAKWLSELVEKDLQKGTRYWAAEGKLWSEENPDSYAGVHNHDGMMVIFDEASGIPSSIWGVAAGYFTEPIMDRYWFAFSNPRRNEGYFFECFHSKRDFWLNKKIDSRTVEGTDPMIYEQIIKENGEDSYQARVEVMGEFPLNGDNQFIHETLIDAAMTREVQEDAGAPLVMGVDVARFGEDRSVISFRRGRDARTIPWEIYKKLDTQELALRVANAVRRYNPDAIFVDGGGVGGGVVDALKAMRIRVIEVQAGGKADEPDKYMNKRVEMWDRLKEWLETGCLPNNRDLAIDLKFIQYSWHPINNTLKLESKDDMKRRGLKSPDMAEALIQTFAKPIARNDLKLGRRENRRVAKDVDYAIFG